MLPPVLPRPPLLSGAPDLLVLLALLLPPPPRAVLLELPVLLLFEPRSRCCCSGDGPADELPACQLDVALLLPVVAAEPPKVGLLLALKVLPAAADAAAPGGLLPLVP